MKFTLWCTKPVFENNQIKDIKIGKLTYDNQTSELWDEDGKPFEFENKFNIKFNKNVFATSEQNPVGKSDKIHTLKIQLGLSCNYSCEYCLQRFVPTAEETSNKHIDHFIKMVSKKLSESPKNIQFWGGEPLVYWKTIKPLSYKLKELYPKASFLMITNGSLLTSEVIDWIEELNVNVGISHDGPGQSIRGPDPFEDADIRKNILTLFEKRPKNTSFNSMLHRRNFNRKEIQDFFTNVLGHSEFNIGEGGFIDAYDEGGLNNLIDDKKLHYDFRRETVFQIREKQINNFIILRSRFKTWYDSIVAQRHADTLGQKCGMDDPGALAVDLRGNVLTCQNVSSVSTAPNGRSHLIGHLNNLEKVKLTTATHWKHRESCSNCPVLQACQGSCMFLKGELFSKSCDNAYSDHIPFFATFIEFMTGWLPFRIEAHGYELPKERQDLWGQDRA